MADPADRALGAAIRRRREARGLQQREMAAHVGLTPVVYGRVELGTRPARAVELREIARVLGVTADELLTEARPLPVREVVQRAAARRDTAINALRGYAASVADAISAVRDADYAVTVDSDADVETGEDVVDWLAHAPAFEGLTLTEDLLPLVRRALSDLAGMIPMNPAKEDGDV